MYGKSTVSFPVLKTGLFSGLNLHYDVSDTSFEASSIDSIAVTREFTNLDEKTEIIINFKLWSQFFGVAIVQSGTAPT